MEWLQFGIVLATFAAVVAGGVFYVRSEVAKAKASELKQLADTRGLRIEDLEKKMARVEAAWAADSKQFKADIARLQGQIEAYQSIKAEEIAVEVARLLGPHLDIAGEIGGTPI